MNSMEQQDLRAKGVNVRVIQGQYGDFFSLGIKEDEFVSWLKDQPKKNGWLNLTLSKQKADPMKGLLKLDIYEKKDNDPVPNDSDLVF